ncbi:hypothetical protein L6452_08397 [Arctium lappa]|uniref:Uncharacterized protein n=1 Tax=Arctium lappa TaxID=4217 RepID=A0ACB9DHG7_ARCLA|nr:hypothetical protein L6452_08397 [Arctium lappa]
MPKNDTYRVVLKNCQLHKYYTLAVLEGQWGWLYFVTLRISGTLTPLVSYGGSSTSSYGRASTSSYGGDAMLSIPVSTTIQIAPQVDDQPRLACKKMSGKHLTSPHAALPPTISPPIRRLSKARTRRTTTATSTSTLSVSTVAALWHRDLLPHIGLRAYRPIL